MSLFLYTAIPIILTTLWLYTAHMTRAAFPQLRNKRICLLIAHPDDEAMFFAPTLLAMTEEEKGNHVKILCLSNGNAENLGPIRTRELTTSALLLGLRSANDILVLDDPEFPDSMTASWSAPAIASVLSSAFSPGTSSSSASKPSSSSSTPSSTPGRSSDAPSASIDVLITFDRHGVSGHANHRSLPLGAQTWLTGLMRGKSGWECPVALYTLTSTNTLRKYIGVFDAPFTMMRVVLGAAREKSAVGGRKSQLGGEGEKTAPRLLFVNDLGQWRRGQKAMTQGHRSQMRWFRWGWVGVGRYMVVNDLRREKI